MLTPFSKEGSLEKEDMERKSQKPCLLRLPEFIRLLSRSKGTRRLPRVSSVGYELSNCFILFLCFFRPFVWFSGK
jgi:hypothetical protein